mmetsp:Transcript_19534/g.30140  ORF Transcript_19534/g.30140 Transcript_19534/m.30140 type:complete len:181 (-) Transcript_19534:167-709(-)|eukprot:CAMPEP_0195291962 /NCGR_PEP_ID=MMETSP0707-20130614/8533_1 /TAXON_ID=33640 /ORGANISM="Asterionellopsis glacialis, Strain CCMP134" /LENGTH=180 /DNA_ID=CAMNT_0040352329 /DNA_START=105 /DNA_END=647 /DNA_ORIENTATION=+
MSEGRGKGDSQPYRRRKAIGVEEFAAGKKKGVTRAIHAYNERKEKKMVEKSKLLRQYQKAMKREGYEPGRGASRKRYSRSTEDENGEEDSFKHEKEEEEVSRRKKMKKSDPLAKSRQRAEEMKQEKERNHQERVDKGKKREAQLQKRKIRAKNMTKRTRKGQPIMKNQISSILEKLERQS